jgi:hypothetical protein
VAVSRPRNETLALRGSAIKCRPNPSVLFFGAVQESNAMREMDIFAPNLGSSLVGLG